MNGSEETELSDEQAALSTDSYKEYYSTLSEEEFPTVLTHEILGFVNENFNRKLKDEIQSGERSIERSDRDKDDIFEILQKKVSVAYHSGKELNIVPLSSQQLLEAEKILNGMNAEEGQDEEEKAANQRKIFELRVRFVHAMHKAFGLDPQKEWKALEKHVKDEKVKNK